MTITLDETLALATISQGTVIDHIPAGQGMRLFRLLLLDKLNDCVTIGLNLYSPTMKKKDMIKIEGIELTPEEASKLAVFAPSTTVAIIREGVVAEKFSVSLPTLVENVIHCPNPSCVTNYEKTDRLFYVIPAGKNNVLRCKYCEKTYMQDEII